MSPMRFCHSMSQLTIMWLRKCGWRWWNDDAGDGSWGVRYVSPAVFWFWTRVSCISCHWAWWMAGTEVYLLIPKWLQTPHGYGESPNTKFFISLPLSIRGLPYGNGETKWLIFSSGDFFLNSQMVTNTLWKWVREWIVPVWKWGRVHPRFHTVIPIWKWGARTSQSPYGNGD